MTFALLKFSNVFREGEKMRFGTRTWIFGVVGEYSRVHPRVAPATQDGLLLRPSPTCLRIARKPHSPVRRRHWPASFLWALRPMPAYAVSVSTAAIPAASMPARWHGKHSPLGALARAVDEGFDCFLFGLIYGGL